MNKKLGKVDTKTLIHALKAYKQKQTGENFEEVLVACGLQS